MKPSLHLTWYFVQATLHSPNQIPSGQFSLIKLRSTIPAPKLYDMHFWRDLIVLIRFLEAHDPKKLHAIFLEFFVPSVYIDKIKKDYFSID